MDADKARTRLEGERTRLLEMLDSHVTRPLSSSQQEDAGELSSYDQHPADAGSDTVEREQAASVAEHAQTALERVDEALRRLEDGSYGVCAACGIEIPPERLEARPEALYCTEHQTERDQRV